MSTFIILLYIIDSEQPSDYSESAVMSGEELNLYQVFFIRKWNFYFLCKKSNINLNFTSQKISIISLK